MITLAVYLYRLYTMQWSMSYKETLMGKGELAITKILHEGDGLRLGAIKKVKMLIFYLHCGSEAGR